jgi:hypothetical protein
MSTNIDFKNNMSTYIDFKNNMSYLYWF